MKKGFRIIKFKKNKPIFEIRSVSKSYDGRPILKKISIKVNPGEIVGLVGANGTGKTTTFQMATGETTTDSGKILIDNKEIQDLPMHERSKAGLAYVPQHRNHFDLSVRDNILGLAQLSIKGEKKQNEVTDSLLQEFGIDHLASYQSTYLSGGESRRLSIAKAMINNPKIILMDEPYSALDPLFIQNVQKYILKLQSYKISILITDHLIKNLFEVCDRIYCLGDQSIIAEGTPEEVKKHTRAVDQYFGTMFD